MTTTARSRQPSLTAIFGERTHIVQELRQIAAAVTEIAQRRSSTPPTLLHPERDLDDGEETEASIDGPPTTLREAMT